MHIKKLEIAGFKSFVDPTTIHFDHDVIGVVGPNGCGKSNIVDAIRWCMGEQSAKHLRGKAMEDVIFNGSESRGPHGLAEVTLTFDNTDPAYTEQLPEEYRDYPEIAVTRRLFRDGTSEYLLNRTIVRLRDVTELFLGTGVGTKAYSIVEQGRIGQIVSSRPEDRRLFIEEAAGITKYKQRRRQAERKMELTRQNLLRVTDIVTEIDRSRASLKRQAAKADRYRRYRGELEDLFLHDASHRFLSYFVTERVQKEQFLTSRQQLDKARGSLQEGETSLEQARQEATLIEERAENASRLTFEADNQVSSLGAEIEHGFERLRHLQGRLDAGKDDIREISTRAEEHKNEREKLTERLTSLNNETEHRNEISQREEQQLEALIAQQTAAKEQLTQLTQQSAGLGTEKATLAAKLEAQSRADAELLARSERLGAEDQTLTTEISSLEQRKLALTESLFRATAHQDELAGQLAELENKHELTTSALAQQHESLDKLRTELASKQTRLDALSELQRRFEGVDAATRELLSAQDPNIVDLVANRVRVPAELEPALVGLLGPKLKYIIVNDLGHGLEALDKLKENQQGQAHLVANHPPYTAGAPLETPDDPEIMGRFFDRLIVEPQDEGLLSLLLGDAWLVGDAHSGLRLSQQHPTLTFVALDGTAFFAGGVVRGGSGDEVASSLLEQRREIDLLRTELAPLKEQLVELEANYATAQQELGKTQSARDETKASRHQAELATLGLERDLRQITSELESHISRLQTLKAEQIELDGRKQSDAGERTQLQDSLATLARKEDEVRDALSEAEASFSGSEEKVTAQRALVTEQKVRRAQIREQLEAAQTALEGLDRAEADLRERSERLENDLTQTAVAFGETAARVMLARAAREISRQSAKTSHAELEEARALLEQVRFALGTREAELKTLRDHLDELTDTATKAEMNLQRIELGREHLLSNVRDRFRGLELTRVIGDYHARPEPDEEQRRRIDELTQLIDRMGPVNLDAQTEYEEAEKRFNELNDQKVDIEKALEDLDRAIKHMNRESRRRFKETFETVAGLFRKTFTRMFQGGRAELRLTQPDDLLASGVDIVAQPPGKKLGNIELMSGGEKALTAVSLIFSIFQYKPSPFCVLDEVDAPLDEANVARYNEAIRSMTNRSQFILVTHVRKTMQSVDVLYGVTMGEPGVSRLVSVKVNENAVKRSGQDDSLQPASPRADEANEAFQVA